MGWSTKYICTIMKLYMIHMIIICVSGKLSGKSLQQGILSSSLAESTAAPNWLLSRSDQLLSRV